MAPGNAAQSVAAKFASMLQGMKASAQAGAAPAMPAANPQLLSKLQTPQLQNGRAAAEVAKQHQWAPSAGPRPGIPPKLNLSAAPLPALKLNLAAAPLQPNAGAHAPVAQQTMPLLDPSRKPRHPAGPPPPSAVPTRSASARPRPTAAPKPS